MKLNVLERLSLLEVMPKEGDYVTLKLVRKLRESLSFSEEEIKQIDFKQNWRCPSCQKEESKATTPRCECGNYMNPTGNVIWNSVEGAKLIKEIHMGDTMLALCVTAMKKLDSEKKMTESYISLYEKITGEKDV